MPIKARIDMLSTGIRTPPRSNGCCGRCPAQLSHSETGVVMLIYLDNAYCAIRERRAAEGALVGTRDLYAAIIEGAVERVRPKMTTVSAIMAGLLPILFTTGTSSRSCTGLPCRWSAA